MNTWLAQLPHAVVAVWSLILGLVSISFRLSLPVCLFCLLQPCDPLSCASSVSLLPLFLSPRCSLFVCLLCLFPLFQPLTNHFFLSVTGQTGFCKCMFFFFPKTDDPLADDLYLNITVLLAADLFCSLRK